MANNYPTEHGDVYLLEDRKELGWNLDGKQFSSHPTPTYQAGQAITKGYAISLGNSAYLTANPSLPGAPGQVYLSVEGILDKCIGISMSTVSGSSSINLGTLTGITVSWTVLNAVTTYTLTGTASNSASITLDGVARAVTSGQTASTIATNLGALGTVGNYTYASAGAGKFTSTANSINVEVLDHGIYDWTGLIASTSTLSLGTLTGVVFSPTVLNSTTTYLVSGTVTNGSSGTVTVNGTVYTFTNGQTASQIVAYFVALGTVGFYTYSQGAGNSFVVTTNPFLVTDIGNTAYILAQSSGSLTSPNQQFTTNRNLAAASGAPLIEVGMVKSVYELFIDFEGDTRGAANLSTVSANAGEYLYAPSTDVTGTTAMTTGTPGGSGFTAPFMVSLGTDGNLYVADRRKSQGGAVPNRNNVIGFVSGAGTWPATPGQIPLGTACVVQKAGVLSGFSGLTPGLPVYCDKNGAFAQNIANFSYYTDIAVPVGFAFTATSIYVEIGFSTQTSDSNPIGSLYSMRNATPDAGYLSANGNTINVVGLTTSGFTGANVAFNSSPFLDGTSLFGFIGTTYGGTVQWTVTGITGANTGQTFYINGIQYAVSGSTNNALATQIGGISQAGYTFSNPSGGVFAIQNASSVLPPVISFGTLPSTCFNITGGTFLLPNYTGTPAMQIRYANFYQANPPQAPVFRYDSNWNVWGTVPSGSGVGSNITLGSSGSYIEFPTTTFGYDIQATDVLVEMYVSKGGVVRRINPAPIVSGANKYGFQVSKDLTNYLKLEFAAQGLAYFDTASTQTYIALDSTWMYRFYVYRPQQFNKFYDYTQDQWYSQFKALALVDYNVSVTTQGTGYFDRGTTAPIHTPRLNYDGNLYTTNEVISDSLTVNATAGGTSLFNGNLQVKNSSLSILNGVTTKWTSDLNGNVTQAGNLTMTGGNIDVTGQVKITNFSLLLYNGVTQKFSVDTSGNVANAGTLQTTGNATFSANANINGTTLDSTSATFNMFATPTTVNVGTTGAFTFNVNSGTSTFQGSGAFFKGTLQVGGNTASHTVEAELDFWKKSTTLIGAQFIMDSTASTPNLNLFVENGAGSLARVAKFSSLNTSTNPNILFGYTTLQISGTGNGSGKFGIRTGIGGTDYGAELVLTNTASGATNVNKFVRMGPTGNLEIVNSAYNNTITQISDAGILIMTPGSLTTGYVGGWINGSAGRVTIPTAQPATITNGDIWVV